MSIQSYNLKQPTLRCLVVEDEEFDRIAISLALKKTGLNLECIEAQNLEDAAGHMANREFDIVFLDHHLPDGLGADFAIELKLDASKKDLRIFMITSAPDVAKRSTGGTIAWDGILDKDDMSPLRLRSLFVEHRSSSEDIGKNAKACKDMILDLVERDPGTAIGTINELETNLWDRLNKTSAM